MDADRANSLYGKPLSKTELHVAVHVANGLTSAEIVEVTGRNLSHILELRRIIHAKLGITNLAMLARYFQTIGLVSAIELKGVECPLSLYRAYLETPLPPPRPYTQTASKQTKTPQTPSFP